MVLEIPGGLFKKEDVTALEFRSAETNQVPIAIYSDGGGADIYELVHTVTTGKTFYLTTIVFSSSDTDIEPFQLATGEAASEVIVFRTFLKAGTGINAVSVISLVVPMKFTSGTKISFLSGGATTATAANLIGFEE